MSSAAGSLETLSPAPAVTTPGQWLWGLGEVLQLSGLDLPECLGSDAERLLWEVAIRQDLGDDAAALFDIAGLAQTAQAAHALTALWGTPAPSAPEALRFARWQRQFDRLRGPRMDASRWQRAVLQRLDAAALASLLPQSVRWMGFDRLTPLEHDLIAALAARGIASEIIAPQGPPATPQLRGYANTHDEYAAIAAWAADHRHHTPNARLGIVALDLAVSGAPLRRALDAVLPGQFNLSLGAPLGQTGLVRSALDALHLLTQREITKTQLSHHLTCPYWPGDADARALHDAVLRDQPGETTAPPWPAPPPQPALPSAWRDWIRHWLIEAGWPGDRPLDSYEHQVLAAFADLLQHFGTLDAVCAPMSLPHALSYLNRMAREQAFQPQTLGQKPIEVLGILESSGLPFDALWVTGLNADTWPQPPRPNPLLPYDWQRRLEMPHASSAVERDFALRVQARLLRAAPEVVFSWVREHRSVAASPLIAVAPEFPDAAPSPWSPPQLESLADHRAPPLSDAERACVHGGAGLFKAQAVCPAWAFYRYRLFAQALPTPEPWLNPRVRGSLMHRALELFWQQTRTHAGLTALSFEARSRRIEACATRAIIESLPQLPPVSRRLEQDRIVRYLGLWLEAEAAQTLPFDIESLEQEYTNLALGPLTLARIKIDRIDRLENGSLRVIDYKTSKTAPSTRGLSDERLCEPQIPLYAQAAAQSGPIGVAAFGHLSPDRPRFIGLTGEALDAALSRWPAQLQRLASEFADGDAAVRYGRIQDHCEVLPLLRLAECNDAEDSDDAP